MLLHHMMSQFHCGKRFEQSLMCSKYHTCHTKSRLNHMVSSHGIPIPLGKGIAAKSRVLKVPRPPLESTIELCRFIAWCPSSTAKSDSNKASCAQSTTPATWNHNRTMKVSCAQSTTPATQNHNWTWLNHTVWSHDIPVPQRKAIRTKPHVLKVPGLPRKIMLEHDWSMWSHRMMSHSLAKRDCSKVSCAQSTAPTTQKHDWTMPSHYMMSQFHREKRFEQSLMCLKYYACHTKSRLNSIEPCGFITWYPSSTAESDSSEASCAYTITPATQNHD